MEHLELPELLESIDTLSTANDTTTDWHLHGPLACTDGFRDWQRFGDNCRSA